MSFTISFFTTSILLGIGLAMDAFSISVANGIKEPKIKLKRSCLIAGIYAFFQFIMPLIGWICVHTIAQIFSKIQILIPWIALLLLLYIGIKLIIDGIKCKKDDGFCNIRLSFKQLLIQGVATSIDALSVGFAIENYNSLMAFICAVIIAIVTFILCMLGLKLGKKIGEKIIEKASIVGGIILIIIGIEIFIKGVFF